MNRSRSVLRVPGGALLLAAALVLLMAGVVAACGDEEPAVDDTPVVATSEPGAVETVSPTPEPGASAGGGLPEGATHTIRDILSAPVEDERVVLVGKITRMRDSEDFVLGDGTGKILVDGDDDFGRLAVGDTVRVSGEVDVEDSPSRVEIEATSVERL